VGGPRWSAERRDEPPTESGRIRLDSSLTTASGCRRVPSRWPASRERTASTCGGVAETPVDVSTGCVAVLTAEMFADAAATVSVDGLGERGRPAAAAEQETDAVVSA